MKKIALCFCCLAIACVTRAQNNLPITPVYDPANPQPYNPVVPQTLPEGYKYIAPMVTMLMDIEYFEPVFLPSSQKNDKPKLPRPSERLTTFKLYPNPAQNFTHLSWNWFAEGLDSSFNIRIINLQGQVVSVHNVEDSKTNNKLIQTDNLVTGMYLIEVLSVTKRILFNSKLVIQ